jgi:hypothetical protein
VVYPASGERRISWQIADVERPAAAVVKTIPRMTL